MQYFGYRAVLNERCLLGTLALVVILALPSFAFAQSSGNDQTSYFLYQNNNAGFSVEYPNDWTYSEKTIGNTMVTYFYPPNDSHTFIEFSYNQNTNYVGTDQQILGNLPQPISELCSNASIAKNGFTCSDFVYNTSMDKYHGNPTYVMKGKMMETFSDNSKLEQDVIQALIISQKSDYGVFITCSKDKCDKYNNEFNNFLKSLNIYQILYASAPSQGYAIPSWIKNTAKWWSEGSVNDDDFSKGIQYLIQQGIIVVSTTQVSSQSSHGIPSWIKNTAKWWSEGEVGDSDFIQGIQYMIENGIIVTSVQPGTTSAQMITYTNKEGITLNVLAIPNEVLLFVNPTSNPDDVNQMISSNGGNTLSQVPEAGYYVVKVDDVGKFISSSYQHSFVIDSFPNEILSAYIPTSGSLTSTGYVDLTKTNWKDVKIPDNTKVLVAHIDDFIYGKEDCQGQPLPHGLCVSKQNDALNAGVSDVTVLRLQDKHGSNIDSKLVIQDIQDAMSIAQQYNLKLVINLSLGTATSDKDGNVYSDVEDRVKANIKHYLDAVMNTKYFQDGNVIISQAAPDDHVDLSKINQDLQNDDHYGKAFNSYITTSQVKEDANGNQVLTTFVHGATSAYGDGVVFVKRENNCGGGTSCAVYGTTTTQALLWSLYPDMKSYQMTDLIKSNTSTQGGKYPVVDPKNTFLSAWQKYKCSSHCPNIGQSDNTVNHLPQNPTPTQTQTTTQAQSNTQPYGKYSTAQDYCQGTYGSNYRYDSSRNLCVPSSSGTSGGSVSQGSTNSNGIDLTGQWDGTAGGTVVISGDSSSPSLTCQFGGHINLDLTQNGKSLTGNVVVSGISLSGDGCDQAQITQVGGSLSATVFGSGFSGSVDRSISVNGQFTSDLMRGTYSGNEGGYVISGDFTSSRSR